jgi:hypothetical protein
LHYRSAKCLKKGLAGSFSRRIPDSWTKPTGSRAFRPRIEKIERSEADAHAAEADDVAEAVVDGLAAQFAAAVGIARLRGGNRATDDGGAEQANRKAAAVAMAVPAVGSRGSGDGERGGNRERIFKRSGRRFA